MVKPHIISKIVNPNTKEETITKVEKSKKLVSTNTINKIKDLMETVIQPSSPTGRSYYLEGYSLIGKTGTAQIYQNGRYLTGSNDYIVSIALMYPKEDPQIIIYAAARRPSYNVNLAFPAATKELVENISKYKNMFDSKKTSDNTNIVILDNYVSSNTETISNLLTEKGLKPIVIGSGNSIIKQYPTKSNKVIKGDRVFLLTNSNEYSMLDLTGYSRIDVTEYCKLLGINPRFEGYGYVSNQSIDVGTIINKDTSVLFNLSS